MGLTGRISLPSYLERATLGFPREYGSAPTGEKEHEFRLSCTIRP